MGGRDYIYITYREIEGDGARKFLDITIYGSQTHALLDAVKHDKKYAEVPIGASGYNFLWIIEENAKNIPAWKRSDDR